jgi:hypothetical protein
MPELARQPADGVIDRSKTRDTPCFPLAAKPGRKPSQNE